MAEMMEVPASSPTELLAAGRRDLAVRDYSAAVESLAKACELLAKEYGDTGDQCAEVYLWYGKALLGLSREENGVLGDRVPGTNDEEDDIEEQDNSEEEATEDDGDKNGDIIETSEAVDKMELEQSTVESINKEDKPIASVNDEQPGTANGEVNDESMANLENEDDIDNLQLAWEMLDLARSILERRLQSNAEDARSLLADVHLALGEVALESETYDKAVIDMQKCLEIQKGLYGADDRRIAETHYQIGLANSLASNFEDAITHFKNAANILESRIKTLENPTTNTSVKKHSSSEPSAEAEIKELKELLPEIQEKIQDMMDYKAETVKRLRETLCPSNGDTQNGASSSEAKPKPAVSDISHLIKRKRKPSETEEPVPKKVNT